MLQRCEKMRRQLPAIEHPLINQVGEQADATELGGKLPSAWPTGLGSPAEKHRGAFTRLLISAHGAG